MRRRAGPARGDQDDQAPSAATATTARPRRPPLRPRPPPLRRRRRRPPGHRPDAQGHGLHEGAGHARQPGRLGRRQAPTARRSRRAESCRRPGSSGSPPSAATRSRRGAGGPPDRPGARVPRAPTPHCSCARTTSARRRSPCAGSPTGTRRRLAHQHRHLDVVLPGSCENPASTPMTRAALIGPVRWPAAPRCPAARARQLLPLVRRRDARARSVSAIAPPARPTRAIPRRSPRRSTWRVLGRRRLRRRVRGLRRPRARDRPRVQRGRHARRASRWRSCSTSPSSSAGPAASHRRGSTGRSTRWPATPDARAS